MMATSTTKPQPTQEAGNIAGSPDAAVLSKAAAKNMDGALIRYIGTADRKVLTSADFERIGSDTRGTFVWDRSNVFLQKVQDKDGADRFDVVALEYMDKIDENLVVVTKD